MPEQLRRRGCQTRAMSYFYSIPLGIIYKLILTKLYIENPWVQVRVHRKGWSVEEKNYVRRAMVSLFRDSQFFCCTIVFSIRFLSHSWVACQFRQNEIIFQYSGFKEPSYESSRLQNGVSTPQRLNLKHAQLNSMNAASNFWWIINQKN